MLKKFVFYVDSDARSRRAFLVTMLAADTSRQYRVTMFHRDTDALDTMDAGVRPHILIMPMAPAIQEMNIVERARAIVPGLPVIFLSSHENHPYEQDAVAIAPRTIRGEELILMINRLTAEEPPKTEYCGTVILIDPFQTHEKQWTGRLELMGFKVSKPIGQDLIDTLMAALGETSNRVVIVEDRKPARCTAIILSMIGMHGGAEAIQAVFDRLWGMRLLWPETPIILIDPPTKLIRKGEERIYALGAIPITDSFPQFLAIMHALQLHGIIP